MGAEGDGLDGQRRLPRPVVEPVAVGELRGDRVGLCRRILAFPSRSVRRIPPHRVVGVPGRPHSRHEQPLLVRHRVPGRSVAAVRTGNLAR